MPNSSTCLDYTRTLVCNGQQKLECNVNYNVKSYLGNELYPDADFNIKMAGSRIDKELYLFMRLPGYDPLVSQFKGTVRLVHNAPAFKKQNSMVTLTIEKGKQYPLVKMVKSGLHFFAQRDQTYLAPVTEEEKLDERKVGKIESYGYEKHPDTGKPSQIYLIHYKLGEYFGGVDISISCQFDYWQDGETDNKGNKNIPLILDYTYNQREDNIANID